MEKDSLESIPTANIDEKNEKLAPLLENPQLIPVGRPYNIFYIIQMTLIIAMGGFLFGYDTGIIGGAALYFEDDFPEITDGQKEMIVSLAIIGAGVGAVIMGPVSDNYGRKISMFIGDVLFGGGALLVTFKISKFLKNF